MIDCLILGDSIAVGTHKFKPECRAVAKGGINSWQFNKNYNGEFFSGNVVISLGSNDHAGVKTRKELEDLRSRVLAKNRVYWILPGGVHPRNNKPVSEIQADVKAIAEKYGDIIVPITSYAKEVIEGKAVTIHPDPIGYKEITRQIK